MRFFGRVLAYFRPDLPKAVGLLGLIGGSTLLGLAAVWPMAILVDTVLARPAADAPAEPDAARVWLIVGLAAATFVLRLVQELLSNARGLLHTRITHNGLLRVRCDLFRKLQMLGQRFHRSQSQGDTLYRLTNDALGFQQIANVLLDLVVATCTLAIMLS